MGRYKWLSVTPPPFGNKKKGGRVVDIKPMTAKFNSDLNAWVFYLDDEAVCSRGEPCDGIIGVKLIRGTWFWKLEKQ